MSDEHSTIAPEWYKDAFGTLYPIVYAHRTVAAAAPEAAFAVRETGLRATDCVLDLCCGNGRHLFHLAGHAAHATGLDYSPQLLALARTSVDTRAALVRADMRSIPFVEAFDVVTSFFTSFGYFLLPEENLRVVRGVSRALRRSGRLFIDYLNPTHVKNTLVPHSVRHHDAYQIVEERWIDTERERVNKTTNVLKDGRPVAEFGESVKLYEPNEFQALLAEGGLLAERVWGDYSGVPPSDDQPRMIVLARKA